MRGSDRSKKATDIAEFHKRMQDKYAGREQQQRQRKRLVRLLLFCSMGLVAFSLAFVLVYLWYTGKL